jgi:hypothetical protein
MNRAGRCSTPIDRDLIDLPKDMDVSSRGTRNLRDPLLWFLKHLSLAEDLHAYRGEWKILRLEGGSLSI